MRSLAAIVLSALALTGCVGQNGAPEISSADVSNVASAVEPGATPLVDAATASAVPLWHAGDAWAIVSHGFGDEQRSFLVVTAADTASYTIGTTSEQAAGFDAMYDVSYIGRIRASDLAGAQQEQIIQFFDFPLADGKTWSTTWDGLEVALTATKSVRGFDIIGKADGEDYVSYDYAPDLRWWSHLDFVRDEYGFKVESAQSGWKGSLVTATATQVYASEAATPVVSPNIGSFTMDEGQSYGMVALSGGGAAWARAFYLVDPAGQPYLTQSITNIDASGTPLWVAQQEQIPATPGEWRLVSPAVHDPTGGFSVTVHEVALTQKDFA